MKGVLDTRKGISPDARIYAWTRSNSNSQISGLISWAVQLQTERRSTTKFRQTFFIVVLTTKLLSYTCYIVQFTTATTNVPKGKSLARSERVKNLENGVRKAKCNAHVTRQREVKEMTIS